MNMCGGGAGREYVWGRCGACMCGEEGGRGQQSWLHFSESARGGGGVGMHVIQEGQG